MISRSRINGFRGLFVFNSLCRMSTTVAPSQPRKNPFLLVDYLINTFGLSKEEALSSMKKMPVRLQDILYMVENEFGIPRNSAMFYYGISAASTISKKTIDMKIGVLRSFGFSDLTLYGMIKKFPTLVRTSEDKMRRVWNFFVKEIGCDPDFLASHPNVFNFSLEKRVIPRYEIMKTLKEKNLTKRKPGLYKLLNVSESNFVNHFVLPYKDEIPDMVDSYFAAVGRKKT